MLIHILFKLVFFVPLAYWAGGKHFPTWGVRGVLLTSAACGALVAELIMPQSTAPLYMAVLTGPVFAAVGFLLRDIVSRGIKLPRRRTPEPRPLAAPQTYMGVPIDDLHEAPPAESRSSRPIPRAKACSGHMIPFGSKK